MGLDLIDIFALLVVTFGSSGGLLAELRSFIGKEL